MDFLVAIYEFLDIVVMALTKCFVGAVFALVVLAGGNIVFSCFTRYVFPDVSDR